nr:MAG TPA: hypothetical protein [Microviridae sp. cttdF6]
MFVALLLNIALKTEHCSYTRCQFSLLRTSKEGKKRRFFHFYGFKKPIF